MNIYNQEAKTLFNGKNIYIFLGKDDGNERFLISAGAKWSEELGSAYHQFSYKNEKIATIGRENEKENILEFLGKEDKFKILIITGKAGTGKSRLVYYTLFKNEDVKKTWSVYGLNYDELQYFT